MIQKQALDEFLKAPRNNYTWIKEVDRDELIKEIKQICPQFNPKLPLFTHQLASVYLGLCLDQFLFFLDMGLGKTPLSLTLIELRKIHLKQIEKALVVVPNMVNIENWLQETNKFTHLTSVGLIGTKDQRQALLKTKADFYVINYDGLKVMMTELKAVSKSKKKRVIQNYQARNFANQFQMIILDEIHHVKHTTSLNFQLCEILSKHIPYRIGLTGTPMGRDPVNLWSQFYVIDHGETLSHHKNIFLHALFKPKTNFFGGLEFYLPKKQEALLYTMMLNRSIRYSDTECADLPEMIFTQYHFNLPGETYSYYRQLILDAIEQRNQSDSEKRVNVYSKTRQLCSGFIYEGDKKERTTLTFKQNPKLEAVEEILDDLPSQSKLVIFHIFEESGQQLHQLLTKLKIKHALIGGSTKTDNVVEYRKFLSDKSVKVLILNVMSGGEGLNLQVANYAILYEPIDRPDVHRQALKRIHRTGQTNRCYVYQFIVRKSVEEKIDEFLNEGKCLFDAIINGTMSLKNLL